MSYDLYSVNIIFGCEQYQQGKRAWSENEGLLIHLLMITSAVKVGLVYNAEQMISVEIINFCDEAHTKLLSQLHIYNAFKCVSDIKALNTLFKCPSLHTTIPKCT